MPPSLTNTLVKTLQGLFKCVNRPRSAARCREHGGTYCKSLSARFRAVMRETGGRPTRRLTMLLGRSAKASVISKRVRRIKRPAVAGTIIWISLTPKFVYFLCCLVFCLQE